MRRFPILQVDAFTRTALAGNPCAVVLDADELGPSEMQAIAMEMNLSETAFVLRSAEADFRARYFTPAEEIPLAGHPTIATVHVLVERGILDPETTPTISLQLEAGTIRVDVEPSKEGGPRVVMSQRRPEFMATYDPHHVMPAFGLEAGDALPGVPIQTVSTGTPQLMIPLRDPDSLRWARLNVEAYEALHASGDFFSGHLFCLEGATPEGRTFARHFGVPPDTFEDPFTGSATGGMAAYLWHYGLLEAPTFVAQQGHWMGRPGRADVEVVGDRNDIETVKVAGTAVTVLEGELRLP